MVRMVSQFRSLVRTVLGADSLEAPELSAGGSPEGLLTMDLGLVGFSRGLG